MGKCTLKHMCLELNETKKQEGPAYYLGLNSLNK